MDHWNLRLWPDRFNTRKLSSTLILCGLPMIIPPTKPLGAGKALDCCFLLMLAEFRFCGLLLSMGTLLLSIVLHCSLLVRGMVVPQLQIINRPLFFIWEEEG